MVLSASLVPLPTSASEVSDAVSTTPGLERGRQLLTHYQCGACHVIPGVAAARGMLGPSLKGFGRRSYIAGEWPNRSDLLQRWLIDPAALVPGTLMPKLGVGHADAAAMAAYLATLR